MSTNHWNVKAQKSWSKIPAGLEVDIIVKNRSGQPTVKEIQEAIEKKYGIAPLGGMPTSIFDFKKG